MAAKNNIRSFRYNDEVARILDQQPGETLNAKFEHLVDFCFNQLEKRRADLDHINSQIDRQRKILSDLENATFELSLLERDLQSARDSFEAVARRAKSIAANFDES